MKRILPHISQRDLLATRFALSVLHRRLHYGVYRTPRTNCNEVQVKFRIHFAFTKFVFKGEALQLRGRNSNKVHTYNESANTFQT